MTLKRTLTAEEHAALDEPIKALYVAAQNGNAFRLDAEADDGVELKTALERERRESRERQQRLDELLKKYEGLDPDEARAALEKRQKQERDELKNKGDFEAREKQLQDKHAQELAALKAERDQLNAQFEQTEIDRVAREALAAEEGSAALLLPIVKQSLKVVREDGRMRVIVVGDDGRPRISNQPGNTGDMTPREYVQSLRSIDEYKPAFKSKVGSGSGDGVGTQSGAPSGASGAKKATEMSLGEKAQFISKHGLDAWTKKLAASQ